MIKSISKYENTVYIAKMSIESAAALTSLAAAITTVLIATKVIAGPEFLTLVANPAGIAALSLLLLYIFLY